MPKHAPDPAPDAAPGGTGGPILQRLRLAGSRRSARPLVRLLAGTVSSLAASTRHEFPLRSRLLHGARGLAGIAALATIGLLVHVVLLVPFTPSIADLKKQKLDQPSVLLSADGKRLATFARMNREWVPLARISPNVVDALIATEDHRFYDHHGVDLRRTAAVMARALAGGNEGGSTITQQLARNLYPEEIGRSRSINRKLKELITALKIEQSYTKQEILETYLNTVPFLYNAFGIEMAARTYFDKPAARLNVVESATLIGMLKGTSYYNPVQNPERSVKRRNVVLAQMRKRGVLSQENFTAFSVRPLRLNFERQEEAVGPAPHFAEHVRKWMIDWADRNDYNLYSDGLVITGTLDSRLQDMAAGAVERQLDALQAVADVEWGLDSERLISTSAGAYAGMRRRIQPFAYFWDRRDAVVDAFIRDSGAYRNAVDGGAPADATLAALRADRVFMNRLRADKTRLQTGFVALDPRNGQVRAWVGSRDFATDQYDHVARAQRQPGSTFKPFVYGAALERGMSPQQRFVDEAVAIEVGRNDVWRPTDLTAASGRSMTISEGLMYSKNTITAQVMREVGPGRTIDFARRLGVDRSALDAVPALALGVSPVTPLEMVSAYGTIAAGGVRHAPVMVTRIASREGEVLAEFAAGASQAMSAETAQQLTEMLRGVIRQGTGNGVRGRFGLRGDLAGKTGTTQNNADGWFILMHPELVAGAWVGFNDSRVTMRSSYWGQGGHNALLVVGDFFQRAINGRRIDGRARFETAQPTSFFGPLLETVSGWFGGTTPVAPQGAPKAGVSSRGDTTARSGAGTGTTGGTTAGTTGGASVGPDLGATAGATDPAARPAGSSAAGAPVSPSPASPPPAVRAPAGAFSAPPEEQPDIREDEIERLMRQAEQERGSRLDSVPPAQ